MGSETVDCMNNRQAMDAVHTQSSLCLARENRGDGMAGNWIVDSSWGPLGIEDGRLREVLAKSVVVLTPF